LVFSPYPMNLFILQEDLLVIANRPYMKKTRAMPG
jgi:hypothetical protein